jgi:hypothetical protein
MSTYISDHSSHVGSKFIEASDEYLAKVYSTSLKVVESIAVIGSEGTVISCSLQKRCASGPRMQTYPVGPTHSYLGAAHTAREDEC